MKKFEQVAMLKNHKNWKQAIQRETDLYSHTYGLSTMRTDFDRDYTRIINSNAYKRLKHKTQVFFSPENDHICTRIEHVNLVESVSYTIARFLGLNTELTRSIAVAHDLGHSAFGHQGEKILSAISEREIGQTFWHEKNGLHFVDDIELLPDFQNKKRNLNLTYAVRDGIISHCGEIDENCLKPRNKWLDLTEYTKPNEYAPYTWEACVVKIADKISYIGRDIEDAKIMKLLTDQEIKQMADMIQKIDVNHTNIINFLTVDLCQNSSPEKGLRFSKGALEIMKKIKDFNYEKIYRNEKIAPSIRYFKVVMNEIFYCLRNEFDGKRTIYHLKNLARYYPNLAQEFVTWLANYAQTEERNKAEYNNKIIYDLEKVEDYSQAIIDYISGMTDQYITQVYHEIVCF